MAKLGAVVCLLAIAACVAPADASHHRHRGHHRHGASPAPETTCADKADTANCNVAAAPASPFDSVITSVKELSQRPASEDQTVIIHLKRNMNALPPPFLYELSRRLFVTDKQESLYYLYLAAMRAGYDGMRCRDKSAIENTQTVIASLQVQMQPIIEYLQTQPDLGAVFQLMKNRDEMFAGKASPWWICSRGIAVAISGANGVLLQPDAWLTPESAWPQAQTEVRRSLDQAIAKTKTN